MYPIFFDSLLHIEAYGTFQECVLNLMVVKYNSFQFRSARSYFAICADLKSFAALRLHFLFFTQSRLFSCKFSSFDLSNHANATKTRPKMSSHFLLNLLSVLAVLVCTASAEKEFDIVTTTVTEVTYVTLVPEVEAALPAIPTHDGHDETKPPNAVSACHHDW